MRAARACLPAGAEERDDRGRRDPRPARHREGPRREEGPGTHGAHCPLGGDAIVSPVKGGCCTAYITTDRGIDMASFDMISDSRFCNYK